MVRPTLSVVPARRGATVPPTSTVRAAAMHTATLSSEPLRWPSRLPLPSLVSGSEWTVKAVCALVDPDILFVTGAAQREAAKICGACPVRLECLADALDNRIEYGVWGGMTERQRRAVLKKSPEVRSWRAALEGAKISVDHEAAS